MNTFKSYSSYRKFQIEVRNNSRYFFDSETQSFLTTLLETSKSRIEKIRAGTNLWRSQLGFEWEPYFYENEHVDDIPGPFTPKRMKPLKESAKEGRANPKGIPYLYLSTDKDTAMAEVRPWIGSYISLAQFKMLKEVKLVNCSSDQPLFFLLDEPPPEKYETAVWGDINSAFSTPITPNEDSADYVPTQIIAELFKDNGYNGIAYRSALGKGYNIALFDLDLADLINCRLFRAENLTFKFSLASNTYFTSKSYKKKE